jgi:hypothetical protein
MEARLTLRSLLLCVAGIVAAAALASACGGGSGGTAKAAFDPPGLLTYRGSGLTFRHPAAWTAYPFHGLAELHFMPLVYLSTQPVQDPCSTHGGTTRCGFPIRHLRPGGVLVVWEVNGLPAVLGHGPGERIRVGGHLAKRGTNHGGVCRSIGGDRTIEVTIQTSRSGAPLTYFTACLRGPHLAQNERRIDALLASTRFARSS